MKTRQQISGQIVDVVNSRIYRGTIHIDNGKIKKIVEDDNMEKQIIMI